MAGSSSSTAMLVSDDDEEEELMDLMPANLAGLAAPGQNGGLDKLLSAQLLKAGSVSTTLSNPAAVKFDDMALNFTVSRVPAKLGATRRRRPITKLNIPLPDWGTQEPQKKGRSVRSVKVGTGRKPVTKLDIRVPDWDSEKLIVEEEPPVAAYFSSASTSADHQNPLCDPSPTCGGNAVADYLQAQAEFMKSPAFECGNERPGSPTPPANPLAHMQMRTFRDDELVKCYKEARQKFFESPELFVRGNGASPATPPPLELLVAKTSQVPQRPVLASKQQQQQQVGAEPGAFECHGEVEADSSPGSAASTIVTNPFSAPAPMAENRPASPGDVGGSEMTTEHAQPEVQDMEGCELPHLETQEVVSTPKNVRLPFSSPRTIRTPRARSPQEEQIVTQVRSRTPECHVQAVVSTPEHFQTPQVVRSTSPRTLQEVGSTSPRTPQETPEQLQPSPAPAPAQIRTPPEAPVQSQEVVAPPEQLRTGQEALSTPEHPQQERAEVPDEARSSHMEEEEVQKERQNASKAGAKRRSGKRRSREAEASPGLQGGTKWVDGQRRSTRIRSRPLETWRGERLLYARVHSTMVTLIGVKHASPLPPWPKRGQYKYNYKVESFVSEEHDSKLKLAAYG